MLPKPLNAQATLPPAFNVCCVMKTREQQNRNLPPISDSERHGERNPRVFLKAKVDKFRPLSNSIQTGIKFLNSSLFQKHLRNNLGLERKIT